MQLKDYQTQTLDKVKEYLAELAIRQARWKKYRAEDSEYQDDYVQRTWNKVMQTTAYTPRTSGIGDPLPNFCLKIPTGGGKTLLATHVIDAIQKQLLNKNTGLILWIVPTSQIYNQTLTSLRDRDHPYRQVLDLSSAGRTVILEKTDRFTPSTLEESLVVMLLMLPSANRKAKETLKLFQDAAGFEAFFPAEDDLPAHEALLKRFTNLDCYNQEGGLWGKQVLTSLGNTLRVLQPVIIIDEGQKAYSEGAQQTIRGFNPCIVVELSATPPKPANILVRITGQALNREQMIKLDINVTNKQDPNWKFTLKESVDWRNHLEIVAIDYRNNTNVYIRPISLIQVERTGKDQIDSGFIHAEQVREYLLTHCAVSADQIAIKTSEIDDIENKNLYSEDCPIRYIITKQALQEGWDCSFAYVLTILTNPKSETAITQLVGRILRQPQARKTGVRELDECYVYCFQQQAGTLMRSIKNGLESEGLGDLTGRVIADDGLSGQKTLELVGYRDRFKHFEGNIYLPHFIIQEESGWRELRYEMDLISRLDWGKADFSELYNLVLPEVQAKDEVQAWGLSSDPDQVAKLKDSIIKPVNLSVDILFATRHVNEYIPNPWVACEIAERAFALLREKYPENVLAANQVFLVEELIKVLKKQRDILAEKVFRELMQKNQLVFFLQKGTGFLLPKGIRVNTQNLLYNTKGEYIQRSLFEKVDKDGMNSLEESVALCLDEQIQLLFWYRNVARVDYGIQGWKQHRIYPDYLATTTSKSDSQDYSKVYVLETKGNHLDNPDTQYKQTIFDLCNAQGKQITWQELGLEFSSKEFEFQVVFDEEWKRKMNELFTV